MALLKIAIILPDVIDIISVSFVVLYSIFFLLIIKAWSGIKEFSPSKTNPELFVSIIIAARNEEENLPIILKNLENQSYPAALFEVIIIDDHSSNRISDLAAVKNSSLQKLNIICLEENFCGKKQALIKGVQNSSSELILFTDADCRVGPDWITSIVQLYHLKNSGLIVGMIDYEKPQNMVQYFARLEQLALTITGAGTAALGYPTLCNGANLAVKRSLYIDLINDLKTNIASGDDLFLLHSINKNKKETIEILRSRDSIVYTSSPPTIRQLLSQRARWVSKSTRYTDYPTIFLALLVAMTNMGLLCSMIFAISHTQYLGFTITCLIKIITDCLITGVGLNYFGSLRHLVIMPLFVLIYPYYMIFTLLIGLLKQFTWKGR